MTTDTPTLIAALRTLARDIQSGDGVANAAIAEAADRLELLSERTDSLEATIATIRILCERQLKNG